MSRRPVVHMMGLAGRVRCGRAIEDVLFTMHPAEMTCANCRSAMDRSVRSQKFMEVPLPERRKMAAKSPTNRRYR